MTAKEFKCLALSFDGTIEKPHFERTAFKVINKRIFATLLEEKASANIVLPVKDQGVFCAIDKAIYPIPNKWGTHGWTTFELKNLAPEIVLDALDTAYKDVIKPKAGKK
ncbi:MAG: MmcQ/YjbR family DNA-binding protein [Bacteroidota bacterium]|nr:MmcQ/YjbR family DNA-binding protein [Bacteroidota bacterium]